MKYIVYNIISPKFYEEKIFSSFNHKVNRVIWKLNKSQQMVWGFKKYRTCVERTYKYISFLCMPGTFQDYFS